MAPGKGKQHQVYVLMNGPGLFLKRPNKFFEVEVFICELLFFFSVVLYGREFRNGLRFHN